MTPPELQALIALGEGQLIEFKPFGGGVSVTSLAETKELNLYMKFHRPYLTETSLR